MTSSSPASATDGATAYELRVRGRMDASWSTWFDGFLISHDEASGTTTLSGVVADQSELHGLLAKVRDLGVHLVSVTSPASTPSQSETHARPSYADTGQHELRSRG